MGTLTLTLCHHHFLFLSPCLCASHIRSQILSPLLTCHTWGRFIWIGSKTLAEQTTPIVVRDPSIKICDRIVWTQLPAQGKQQWRAVSCDREGYQISAVVDNGSIWRSADGSTWHQEASIPAQSWRSVSSSSDGVKHAAVVTGGNIWISSDSGSSWVEISSTGGHKNWSGITSSVDGTKLAACALGGSIWCSGDSGYTWQEASSIGDSFHLLCSLYH